MISSAAEYEFVTGIQDGEIIIDGDILPVRESYEEPEGIQQPRCLRGEDVAFLAEAANERNSVIAGQAETTAFDRHISAAQMRTICTNLHRHLKSPGSSSDPCYFRKEYIFGEKSVSISNPNYWDFFDSNEEEIAPYRLYQDGILLDKSASPNDFQSNGVLRLDNLRKMFTDVKRQRRMYCGDFYALDIPAFYAQGLSTAMDVDAKAGYATMGPFDNTTTLFAYSYWSVTLEQETHTLASFTFELVTGWRAHMLSSVTVLVTVGGERWDYGGAHEKKRLTMPLTATLSDGKWKLTIKEVSKAVAKMRTSMGLSEPSAAVANGYVFLLAATPIVTLGDHTDF